VSQANTAGRASTAATSEAISPLMAKTPNENSA
jgi:hypothetical protein